MKRLEKQEEREKKEFGVVVVGVVVGPLGV